MNVFARHLKNFLSCSRMQGNPCQSRAQGLQKQDSILYPGKQTYYCSVDDANLSLNFASQVVSKLLSLQRALRVSASGLALLKDKIAELVPALFSSSPNCEDQFWYLRIYIKEIIHFIFFLQIKWVYSIKKKKLLRKGFPFSLVSSFLADYPGRSLQ